ncbi:MAG: DUF401 family protein [bacterium]
MTAGDPTAGMWALVKIACVFAGMVVLIRRDVPIGYVLLMAAVALGFALGIGFSETETGAAWAVNGTGRLLAGVAEAAVLPGSLRLLCLVLTITVFGAVMGRVEKLQALTDSLLALLRDRRWGMASLASLIGLLPMPGGAMISAPMVGEVARDVDLRPEQKTAINHWMRHVWEYVDPLFPALLLASAVFSVPVTRLMIAHSPLTVAAIVGGVVFLLRRVPHHQRGVGDDAGERRLKPVLAAIAPVFVVVLAALLPQVVAAVLRANPELATRLPGGPIWHPEKHKAFFDDMLRLGTELCMLGALFAVICVLLKANRVGRRAGWALVRGAVTLKLVALVMGVCVLKELLRSSGTAQDIAAYLQSTGLPGPIVIGSVLFVVGMLLGYSFGFVAICYPMLLPMLAPGGTVNYPLAAFAFAMGFLGVLLSPVHLCLVLSREHFDAPWGGVYRQFIGPALLVFATACLMLLWA